MFMPLVEPVLSMTNTQQTAKGSRCVMVAYSFADIRLPLMRKDRQTTICFVNLNHAPIRQMNGYGDTNGK